MTELLLSPTCVAEVLLNTRDPSRRGHRARACRGRAAVAGRWRRRGLPQHGVIGRGVHVVGDVMANALLDAAARADASDVLARHGLAVRGYLLATVHRAENTDDPARLAAIIGTIADIGRPILFPAHPHTRNTLATAGLALPGNIRACDPLGYLDLVRALRDADAVLTDSGSLQKEAYWLGVPCVTLREATEWVETVEAGWNQLVGADRVAIGEALTGTKRMASHPRLYGGDGHASERCAKLLRTGSP